MDLGGRVYSLLHVPGEQRFFAGLENGELVTVDLGSGEVSSRVKLGGGCSSRVPTTRAWIDAPRDGLDAHEEA